MSAPSSEYDVAVVGTGIAGLAAALALARNSCRVVLIGPRQALPPGGNHYHPRVYAISPASRQLLDRLGAWAAMPAERRAPVDAMLVYGDRGSAVELQAWHAGQADLAEIVEATELERGLRNALQVFGVPWIEAEFQGLSRQVNDPRHQIQLSDRSQVRAALLVAADGARSAVRQAAGFELRQRFYDATGLVVHLNAELPHQGRAMQWFTADGILALLPMPDTTEGPQVSMVWSLRSAQAEHLLSLGQNEQAVHLTQRLHTVTNNILGTLQPRTSLRGFPLALQQTPVLAHNGVALVGDAAHVVHPLAGQGLNLGLGDVHALAQAVAEREPWRSAGDERVLRRYARARAEPLVAMRLATDGLYHLFDTPAPPLAWLRNTGMQVVNQMPWLKRQLIRHASGF